MSDDKSDLVPFLSTPGEPQQLTEEEYRERFGPPYGPCGAPCSCKECVRYREKIKAEGPPTPPVVEPEVDEFAKVIERTISNEPRPEWRETMEAAECFVRLFWEDGKGYCDDTDCDLLQICGAAWSSVKGTYAATEEVAPPAQIRRIGKKRKKLTDKKKRNKWKGTGKYDRAPYVDAGRPVDKIASIIWEFLGKPPALPPKWYYPTCKTVETKKAAIEHFVDKYGDGLLVNRRASYHQYMLDGEHLMRLWVNASSGGWMDCSRSLSKAILRMRTIYFEKTPESGKQTKYRFYPYRVFLSRPKSIEHFKKVLANCPGLEYLKENAEQ
jgi:hypothetical protein